MSDPSQTSKHTIEVEVVVKWDVDPRGEYPHQFGIPSFVTTTRWVTSEQPEALGITRPVPPYEPQVGDIVHLTDDAALRLGLKGYYRVSGLNDEGDIGLLTPFGTVLISPKPSDLVFVARPA